MTQEAGIYRSLVGVQLQAWAWVFVQDTSNLNDSVVEVKAKKKWIVLEDKRLVWYYGKSKTREKDYIDLNGETVTLILPNEFYEEKLILWNSLNMNGAQFCPSPSPSPSPGPRWLHVVSEDRKISIKLMETETERKWTEAISIRLMRTDLLLSILDKFDD